MHKGPDTKQYLVQAKLAAASSPPAARAADDTSLDSRADAAISSHSAKGKERLSQCHPEKDRVVGSIYSI